VGGTREARQAVRNSIESIIMRRAARFYKLWGKLILSRQKAALHRARVAKHKPGQRPEDDVDFAALRQVTLLSRSCSSTSIGTRQRGVCEQLHASSRFPRTHTLLLSSERS
jgi:hypothetical protein